LGALLTHWLHVTEADFDNLWLLVTITNLTTLLPLPLLFLLPSDSAVSDADNTALETLDGSTTEEESPEPALSSL
ncbi:folate/biopterin family MFS transporter, partial [Leptolyngbya cf. ectocarpi LEGE 11479]|nr:folate/biopterin family MFS transporter [Leptolyngbya cf. ectocarpi LEGE 11479]